VGRRRAQLLAEHGGYWKAWRLAIEFKRLAAEDLPGFYALPNMVDASRWHALLILPPKVIQPSPYAEAVLRISFEFPELYGEEGTQPQDSVISVFVSSAPFYHPLVDNSSGSFHIPARLLPKDKPADGVALAKIIRKAFSSAFLDTLVPEDLNDASEPGTRRGNPDAMDMLLSDRATFDMIAQQTAEQSASEDALYEAATADGELRIRRAKWTEQELDDAMDRLELAMQVSKLLAWRCSFVSHVSTSFVSSTAEPKASDLASTLTDNSFFHKT
jgi:hypothetical protein